MTFLSHTRPHSSNWAFVLRIVLHIQKPPCRLQTISKPASAEMSADHAHVENDAIQKHLDRLLEARASPKTICPSEVARALSSSELEELDTKEWRDVMPTIRVRVWKMRDQGQVEIMQKGAVLSNDVSLENVKGPIRVRLRRTEEQ